MKSSVLFFFLLLVFNLRAQQNLISRQALFDENRRARFTLSGNGQSLFYQNLPLEGDVLYHQRSPGADPVKIQLSGSVTWSGST
ncbi:MAG: hypothetical protein U5L96_00400 [Owenweeksia sp.]|nr:hypothetical protein [Owenweeksia sp.]